MKLPLPKIRLSRKLLFIVLGMLVLLGGTGAAALYVGGDKFMGPSDETIVGNACTTLHTVVLRTPERHLWLRRYIRMDNADGPTRIRTALRVAGILAKTNPVDLIHVSVLDSKGPEKRADMRARAIGAEVLLALHPENLPDMKEPVVARYFEGAPNAQGRYFGQRVSLDIKEVGAMMTSMKTIEAKEDCVEPEKPAAEDAKNDHGKKKKAEHGEKPAHGEEAKPAEHGAPAEEGDKAAEGHGEKPAEGHEAKPAEEPGFVDSMLGMVGLGGKESPPAEAEHAATEGEHPATAAEGHEAPPAETHGDTTNPGEGDQPADHSAPAEEGAAEPKPHGEDAAKVEPPVEEKSFVDGMLDMVGLGEGEKAADPAAEAEKPADAGHEAAKTDGHDTTSSKEEAGPDAHGDAAAKAEHEAVPAEHGDTPAEEPAAADTETHGEQPADAHSTSADETQPVGD